MRSACASLIACRNFPKLQQLQYHYAQPQGPVSTLPGGSKSRMLSIQRQILSVPLGSPLPVSVRGKPSEIPSRTRSLSAFLPGEVSTSSRSSGKVGGHHAVANIGWVPQSRVATIERGGSRLHKNVQTTGA